MSTKDYLRDIKFKRQQVARLKERRSKLHIEVSFGGIDYSADRVQATPENKLENAMIKLSERLAYLDRRIAELSIEIDDRMNSIESIPTGMYRDVLFKHYSEYKSFEQISVEMGYAYNYTCTIHGEALKELEKHLNFS